MKILYFNLKKIWFDKMLSGEKSHEYREVKKHWEERLECFITHPQKISEYKKQGFPILANFRNGYQKDAPEFICEVVEITRKNGKDTDLNIDKEVYDIELDLSTLTRI